MQAQAAENILKFTYLNRNRLVIALGFFVVVAIVGALFFIRSLFMGGSDAELVRDQADRVESQLEIAGTDVPAFPDLVIDDPFAEIVISELDAPAPSIAQTYVVESGDTLWHIAETYLDSPYQYLSLAAYNSIENPDLIYPGQIIGFSKGKITDIAASIDLENVAQGELSGEHYVVEDGDSLWSIAVSQLADPYAWKSVYEVNKQQIGNNPGLIYPHQVLVLPKQAEHFPPSE